METRLYEIKFKDGRLYRVFCANKHQINRFWIATVKIQEELAEDFKTINGIHNIKDFEKIINSETNK